MESVNLKDMMGDVEYSTSSRYPRELAEYDQNRYQKSEVVFSSKNCIVEMLDLGPGQHMFAVTNTTCLEKFKREDKDVS